MRARTVQDRAVRTEGTVRFFDAEQGFGVIDTSLTPGGCWVHFSAIQLPGYRTLAAGEGVVLDVVVADQDGYGFRAVAVWPGGVEPETRPEPGADTSGAYRSRLVVTADDGTVLSDSAPDASPSSLGMRFAANGCDVPPPPPRGTHEGPSPPSNRPCGGHRPT